MHRSVTALLAAALAAALLFSGCQSAEESGTLPAGPVGERGERPAAGLSQGKGPAAEAPGRDRDSGPAGSGVPAGEDERIVSGTVALIVGNEVTLTLDEPVGETAVYLLPVGMTIGRGDFSSVTAGSRLRIHFGLHPTDGREIITAVESVG